MRSWVPVPGTTSGRLVEAGLDLFGSRGYAGVGVGDLAQRAGVTTGALYHHFGSKAGLYRLIRADVEQRVVDRMEGAASVQPVSSIADLAGVLLTGFDYAVSAHLSQLLGEPPPTTDAADTDATTQPDPIETTIDTLLSTQDPPVGYLIAALWRRALLSASTSAGMGTARQALAAVLAQR